MDFSLQSENNKSVFSVSPSSATNSYFTEQALRAGFMGNEIRRVDFGFGCDPLRDAMQRQIEKERIRQEIIAAEIIRRRELEMEVRRELAMERELALRRGDGVSRAFSPWPQEAARFPSLLSRNRDDIGSDERTAIPSGNAEVGSMDRLPFQRPSEAASAAKASDNGKGPVGQVMFLPTSTSLIGTKRKLAAVGASELNPTVAKKKNVKDWNCALCKVSATSEQGLKEHLEGRKHRAREAELGAKKTTEKHPKEPTSLEKKPEKANPKPAKKQEANGKPSKKKQKLQEKKKKFRYWCEDCNVGTHSQTVMSSHLKGKKHQGRVQAQKQSGGSVSSTTALDDAKPEQEDALEKIKEEVVGNVDGKADDKDQAEEKGEVDDTEEAEEKREIRDVEEAEDKGEIDDAVEAEEKGEVDDIEEAEEKGEVDDIEEAEKGLEEASRELEPSTVTVVTNELMDVSASGTTNKEDSD